MLRTEHSGGANLRLLLAALFPLADPLVLPHRHLTAAATAALGSGGSGGGVAGGAASWSFYRCRGSAPHAAGAAPRLGAPLHTCRHALARAPLASSPPHPARTTPHAPLCRAARVAPPTHPAPRRFAPATPRSLPPRRSACSAPRQAAPPAEESTAAGVG